MRGLSNGYTWLVLGGFILSVLGFTSGWIAKRETAARDEGEHYARLMGLEAWRKEQGTVDAIPVAERYRQTELALARVEERLVGLETVVHDLKLDINVVRQEIRQIGKP